MKSKISTGKLFGTPMHNGALCFACDGKGFTIEHMPCGDETRREECEECGGKGYFETIGQEQINDVYEYLSLVEALACSLRDRLEKCEYDEIGDVALELYRMAGTLSVKAGNTE